eukprot:7431033-Ditylum_brightwellii.AAC.1
MHKPLVKKIAHAKKEHNNDGKGKCHDKSKLCHKRHHSLGKCHIGKHKKKFCDYHGLCYYDTNECNFTQPCRKHVQPTHNITEQQRLQQVRFVKDAEKQAKKCGLSAKEVKDLNAFVKDKIHEMIKECNCNMHAMSNFEDLSLSSINESVQSIIINTSVEGSSNKSGKPASKK